MYKTYLELLEDNPEAIKSKCGDYLERPNDGWPKISKEGLFCGIGHHGVTGVIFSSCWSKAKIGLRRIPSGGYG